MTAKINMQGTAPSSCPRPLAAAPQPAFVSELLKRLGLAAESSLTATLKIMERKELLEIVGGGKQGSRRLVRLTTKAKYILGVAGLPLVGSIPAGPLTEALPDELEIVEINSLLRCRQGDFLLKADGLSMIGDGIFHGDLVLLRPNVDIQQGEIAAVHAGNSYESTLKHVYFEREQVRLKASNPDVKDIIVAQEDWRGVAGVLRGHVRNLGSAGNPRRLRGTD